MYSAWWQCHCNFVISDYLTFDLLAFLPNLCLWFLFCLYLSVLSSCSTRCSRGYKIIKFSSLNILSALRCYFLLSLLYTSSGLWILIQTSYTDLIALSYSRKFHRVWVPYISHTSMKNKVTVFEVWPWSTGSP